MSIAADLYFDSLDIDITASVLNEILFPLQACGVVMHDLLIHIEMFRKPAEKIDLRKVEALDIVLCQVPGIHDDRDLY